MTSHTTPPTVSVTFPEPVNNGSVFSMPPHNVTLNNTITNVPVLTCNGEFILDGESVNKKMKMIDEIERRLAILVPDPAKLEKYEALREAYDHYKLLEALLNEP
jgi:hypothetical protein